MTLYMFQCIRHLKMNPVHATDGSLSETTTNIASRQCVGAADGGARASNNEKGMITGAIG
jgi:hypothetical protein